MDRIAFVISRVLDHYIERYRSQDGFLDLTDRVNNFDVLR